MLTKARIIAAEAKVNIDVMFNPSELQIDKSVSWTPSSSFCERPTQEFKKPQSSTLAVTLYFDGYEQRTDVYKKFVSEIEKTATVVEGYDRPPLTKFSWGTFVFEGVVESLSQKYTMFLKDGTRARCEVALRMLDAEAAGVWTEKSSARNENSTDAFKTPRAK